MWYAVFVSRKFLPGIAKEWIQRSAESGNLLDFNINTHNARPTAISLSRVIEHMNGSRVLGERAARPFVHQLKVWGSAVSSPSRVSSGAPAT